MRGAAAKTDKRSLLLLVRRKVILEFNFILVAFLAEGSLSERTCRQCVTSDPFDSHTDSRLQDSETVNNFQNPTSFKVRVQCDSSCMPPPST